LYNKTANAELLRRYNHNWFLALMILISGIFISAPIAVCVYVLLFGVSLEFSDLFIFLTVMVIIMSLASLVGPRISAFSNEGLRQIIRQIDVEAVRKELPEVMCTLAMPPLSRSVDIDPHDRYPYLKPTVRYVKLSQLINAEEAVDVLLSSAALPEIFPPGNVLYLHFDEGWVGYKTAAPDTLVEYMFSVRYIDGGFADNTPILAVIDQHTSHVIIVYLNHQMEESIEHYQQCDRGMACKRYEKNRLRELATRAIGGRTDAVAEGWKQVLSRFDQVQILPIVPSESLGFSLDLRAKNSRSLMALGYEDALRQLRQWCLQEPVQR
jgi:hypothetical protein